MLVALMLVYSVEYSCCFERRRRTRTYIQTYTQKWRDTHLLNSSECIQMCAYTCLHVYFYVLYGRWPWTLHYVRLGQATRGTRKPIIHFSSIFLFPPCCLCVVWIFQMRTPPHHTRSCTHTMTKMGDMGKNEA